MIVHRRQPTPWWWLLVVAVVLVPWGLNGHWLITGPAWLVIAVLLAWRYRRRHRHAAPRFERLRS